MFSQLDTKHLIECFSVRFHAFRCVVGGRFCIFLHLLTDSETFVTGKGCHFSPLNESN